MSSFHIRSAVLQPFYDLTKSLGADPLKVMQAAGLKPSVFQDPDALIPHTNALKLFEVAMAETGCDHLGLLLGEKISLQSLGLLGLLMRSSPNFGTAMQEMIKHLAVHARGITRELHCDKGIAYLTTGFENPDMAQSFPAVQMSVATNWKVGQLLSHYQSHPTLICFTFAEPANSIFFRRFFKVPVAFNADFNGLVFHASDLNLPIREHDPMLHEEMKRQIGKIEEGISDNFIADVKKFIRQNLDAGICNIDAVIRFFPFQRRTFQSRLKQEGVTYQNLVDEIRFQKAELHLLKSDISVSQLADLLCYKSVSVFSTAFKNKYGLPPSAWKEARVRKDPTN